MTSAEVDHLRKMLAALEWEGSREESVCPACGEYKDQGHSEECWLEPELPA